MHLTEAIVNIISSTAVNIFEDNGQQKILKITVNSARTRKLTEWIAFRLRPHLQKTGFYVRPHRPVHLLSARISVRPFAFACWEREARAHPR